MRDVFDVLKHDHNEVEAMLVRLAGMPAGPERAGLVRRLVIEESKHEAVEEEYFWPTVREFVDGGDDLADHGLRQEQQVKQVLDRLESADAASPESDELVTAHIRDAREHLAYEEGTVWPRLGAAISAEDALELGNTITEAKGRAPTRPHPNTPVEPRGMSAMGKAAAVADRVWDRVIGRGQTR